MFESKETGTPRMRTGAGKSGAVPEIAARRRKRQGIKKQKGE